MTTMTQTPQTPIKAAPIPLISGNTFTTNDGTTHEVATAAIVVTAADGTQSSIALEFRHGGWWAASN